AILAVAIGARDLPHALSAGHHRATKLGAPVFGARIFDFHAPSDVRRLARARLAGARMIDGVAPKRRLAARRFAAHVTPRVIHANERAVSAAAPPAFVAHAAFSRAARDEREERDGGEPHFSCRPSR